MIEVYTDGGSRGNPGKAACAFVIYKDGKVWYEGFNFLGITTNNQAEYQGLLQALRYLIKNEIYEAKFFADSELMVKQVLKLYKVKDVEIQKIYNELIKEVSKFKSFEITHIRREKNKLADMLVNKCLDEH
jgi:ribonuclease HI